MKFLHIADVHLGCRRYNLDERPRDFARAWVDIIERHAIPNAVDFVLIAGDFFHSRKVEPETMNHAMAGLYRLREAGIPVLAIEGNHDQHDATTHHSWLRSLAAWNLIKLLEPRDSEGREHIPWDDDTNTGWYVDINEARIFGSHWYGMSTNAAIPLLCTALEAARDADKFNILMLHTDVEGQLNRPLPALPVARLKELRGLVDYVALGHTHKRFELDNWAFNPGSPEACSIDEYREERGVYLVEIGDAKQVTATLIRDYRQRPFQRLFFDVSGARDKDEVHAGVIEQAHRELRPHAEETDAPAPIIEVNLRGHLGFTSSDLDLARISDEVTAFTRALHVMVKNQTVPVEYAVAAGLDDNTSREDRERRIIENLVAQDNRFKDRSEEISKLIIKAKQLALTDEPADKILDLIATQTGDAPPVVETLVEDTPDDAPLADAGLTARATSAIERNASTL